MGRGQGLFGVNTLLPSMLQHTWLRPRKPRQTSVSSFLFLSLVAHVCTRHGTWVHGPASLIAWAQVICFLKAVFLQLSYWPWINYSSLQPGTCVLHPHRRRHFCESQVKRDLEGAAGAKSGLNSHEIPDT